VINSGVVLLGHADRVEFMGLRSTGKVREVADREVADRLFEEGGGPPYDRTPPGTTGSAALVTSRREKELQEVLGGPHAERPRCELSVVGG